MFRTPSLVRASGYVVFTIGRLPVGTSGVRRPFFPAGKDAVTVVQRKKVPFPADVVAAVVETVPAMRFRCDFMIFHSEASFYGYFNLFQVKNQ